MSDLRAWTDAVLFGTLWGALEISLGSLLHLSRFPLRGMIMASLGLVCLLTLSRLSPKLGNCLLAGLVAAFLKVFALGGLFPGPLIGILAEALIVEVVLDLGGFRLWTSMTAGGLVLALTPLQMALMVRLVAGPEPIAAFAGLLTGVLRSLGLPTVSIGMMLATAALATCLIGMAAGFWAWKISARVLRRMEGRS